MTTIEDLTPENFDCVAAWLSQPQINQWLTSEWRGKNPTSTLIAMMLRNKKNRVFLVRWQNQPVALTALADFDATDATAMVWYFLGEQNFSRRGIVSDALKQMCKKCFAELKLQSLYAWAMADNPASLRVLQKTGFREAGRLRRATFSNGRFVDRIYFDLLPEECSPL